MTTPLHNFKKNDSYYFQETFKRMSSSGWKAHAIRLLFNNGIVDEVNQGKMTLEEGRMHYPSVDSHPCLDKG
jgi:hypothetical protein